MEPISLTLYDLYFVINPFKFSVMDRVLAVIQDAIAISLKHFDKGVYRSVVNGTSQ